MFHTHRFSILYCLLGIAVSCTYQKTDKQQYKQAQIFDLRVSGIGTGNKV